MLGPALGYTLASYCLQLYIAPSLTPTINNIDPRWLGAWWLGWIVLGALLTVAALFLGLCKLFTFQMNAIIFNKFFSNVPAKFASCRSA